MFYSEMLRRVTPNTVIHYHAVIHSALKYAVKTDMLIQNVADKVDRPRKNSFQPVFLSADEMQKMFEALRGTKLELPVLVAAFYGLRRGEVVGLKWDAIDFERNTITIKHIVTNAKIDGKCEIVCADRAKTKSSLRSLPLVSNIREKAAGAEGAKQRRIGAYAEIATAKSMTAMFLWMPWAISSTPEALPPISASCWSRTVCGTFAFTTSDIAAPHCFWQTMCL